MQRFTLESRSSIVRTELNQLFVVAEAAVRWLQGHRNFYLRAFAYKAKPNQNYGF
jgi:hypothetical protein